MTDDQTANPGVTGGAGPVFAEPATAREAIERVMAFSSRDWSEERDLAWLWGIVKGWDPEPYDDDPEAESAMPEVAAQFGWTPEQVATLRRLHEDWGRGR